MSLIHTELSAWEIAFRWAGYDPARIWFRIPLEVRDHFRNLLQAILAEELECSTLNPEKWHPDCGSDPEFFIRHYIDEVYECIHGVRFNRKLLRWAMLDRHDLKKWCNRRGIPPPAFWFPAGSKEFVQELIYREKENRSESVRMFKERRSALFAYQDLKKDDPTRERKWSEIEAMDVELDRLDLEYQRLGEQGFVEEKPSEGVVVQQETESVDQKLRGNQEARIAVQVIARQLWKESPVMRIAEIVVHDSVQRLCGANHYSSEVVRRWVKQVAPPEVSAKRGRPRKNNPTSE